MTTDSPDVLTDGRWVCVRGVQRWVADPVTDAPDSTPIDGQCVECHVEIERAYAVGKCRRCYDSRYRKTDIRRRPSAETVAEWLELKAHGLSVREGAFAMGISLSALYAAIKRANRAKATQEIDELEQARERAGRVA